MTHTTDSRTPLDLFADETHSAGDEDDLPRRMGRDARRVSRGELSEAEFYERYHEAVVERFGFDRRPGGTDR
jgi:hypothetical protein